MVPAELPSAFAKSRFKGLQPLEGRRTYIKYLSQTADYGSTAEELITLAAELSYLEKMHPTIGIITNDRKSVGRSIKDLIADARIKPDKLDDAFEGMVEDDDAFIDGWFAVRKIKGRHKPKDKSPKEPAENN